MALQKITAPDGTEMTGFVVTDLPGAPVADGVVRCAKKILQDGAKTMARSRTYAWALLEQQRSGASAGISVSPEHRSAGIEAFVQAVLPRVSEGALSLDAAKGLAAADLAQLAAVDARSPLLTAEAPNGPLHDELLATSAAMCASAALGGLEGRRVAIEGAGTLGPTLLAVLAAHGATVVAIGTSSGTLTAPDGLDAAATVDDWREFEESLPHERDAQLPPAAVLGAEADVLFCGSKLGLVDDDVAAHLAVAAIVPIGPAPVTAKGLAVASRRDVLVLPDFLSIAGPLHAYTVSEQATAESCLQTASTWTTERCSELLEQGPNAYLAACHRAEQFLSNWVEELPFGRPLA